MKTETDSLVGTCTIRIDIAGPNKPPDGTAVNIPPTLIDSTLSWFIQSCVTDSSGNGGFFTEGFSRVLDYVNRPGVDLTAPFRTFHRLFTFEESY